MAGGVLALHIDAEERPLAYSLFLQAFLLGIPQLFTATVAAALFLDAFSAGDLPYVIMAGGLLVPALGYLLSAALTRFGATATLRTTLALLVAGLGTIAALLAATGGASPVRIALIIWVDVEYAFTELSFTAHANRVLDIRQAKRLFGLVSAGQVLAAMIGGFLAPWLLRFMPVGALLGISLFGLVCAWLNFERMGRRHPLASDGYHEADASAATTVRDPLVRLIFLLVFLEFCVQAFSETIFYAGLQRSLPDAGSVASFLGLFFALAGACKLAINVFGTNPFLARFGLRGGLVAPALLMALPLAVHVLWSLIGGQGSGAFVPLVLVRFLQTVALSSLYAPAYFTLYQPLRSTLRSSAQALADTAVGQIGSGFAGLLLFLLINPLKLGFSMVGAATLALLLVWIVAALRAEKRYRVDVTAQARGGSMGAAGDLASEDGDAQCNGELQDELAVLLREARHADRGEGFEALVRSGCAIDRSSGDSRSSPYRQALELEAALCIGYREAARSMSVKALGATLEREADKALERSMLILALAYSRNAISALRHGLLFSGGGSARGYALELAESTLLGPDRGLILPLFEDAGRGGTLPYAGQPDGKLLRELVDKAAIAGQDWLRTFALLHLSWLPEGAASLRDDEVALLERESPVIDRVLSLSVAPIFRSVPFEDLAVLALSIEERLAPAGTRILTRGEEGSELYLLVSGRVSISIAGTEIARMGAGDVFGELSALSPEPRSADVTALEDLRLLVVRGERLTEFSRTRWRTAFEILKVIDRRVVDAIQSKFPISDPLPGSRKPAAKRRKAIGSGSQMDARSAAEALSRVPSLRSLDAHVLEGLGKLLHLRRLEVGESLYSPGEEARAFFYVHSGRVAMKRAGRSVFELGPGEVFGDFEVVLGERRMTSAVASEAAELLDLPGRALSDLAWGGPDFLHDLTLTAVDRLRLVAKMPQAPKEG